MVAINKKKIYKFTRESHNFTITNIESTKVSCRNRKKNSHQEDSGIFLRIVHYL